MLSQSESGHSGQSHGIALSATIKRWAHCSVWIDDSAHTCRLSTVDKSSAHDPRMGNTTEVHDPRMGNTTEVHDSACLRIVDVRHKHAVLDSACGHHLQMPHFINGLRQPLAAGYKWASVGLVTFVEAKNNSGSLPLAAGIANTCAPCGNMARHRHNMHSTLHRPSGTGNEQMMCEASALTARTRETSG